MLLILIPIAWLIVLTVFVAICLAAARGDAAQSRTDDQFFEVIRGAWDSDVEPATLETVNAGARPVPRLGSTSQSY